MTRLIKYAIYFTAADGSDATITGDEKAIEAIEKIFERSGVEFNEEVETWDDGYYNKTPVVQGY